MYRSVWVALFLLSRKRSNCFPPIKTWKHLALDKVWLRWKRPCYKEPTKDGSDAGHKLAGNAIHHARFKQSQTVKPASRHGVDSINLSLVYNICMYAYVCISPYRPVSTPLKEQELKNANPASGPIQCWFKRCRCQGTDFPNQIRQHQWVDEQNHLGETQYKHEPSYKSKQPLEKGVNWQNVSFIWYTGVKIIKH